MSDINSKPRPIVRLVLLLMHHRLLVSFLCFFAGVITLLLLPVLAKNTYVSENALMPGSATSMLSNHEVQEANKLVSDILGLELEAKHLGIKVPMLLADHMASLGAEVSHFQFCDVPNKFHPLHFFSNLELGMNMSCSAPGISTVGILRAPRGDGKEAIVIVTPYNPLESEFDEALSLGVAYSVFTLLTRVTWLAKDVIWVASDSRFGEYDSVSAFLREYFAPSFGELRMQGPGKNPADLDRYTLPENLLGPHLHSGFRRAGTVAAALVIKVENENSVEDTLRIYAEATNGQMPNLDIINVAHFLAVHRQRLHVKVEKISSMLESKWLDMVGRTIEFLGNFAGSLSRDWQFGIPVVDYVEGTATLASSLYAQALGVPTGSHGPFRDYQIDAITMVIAPKVSPYNPTKRNEFLLRSGRLVEGIIRSVNNLLEKFHQSFFLYLLTGPSKFVSVGVYMISFALLIAPLPVVAASLYVEASQLIASGGKVETPTSLKPSSEITFLSSWRWLRAAKTVLIVDLWGAIVSFLPFFICEIPNRTPTTSLLCWVLLSLCSLHVLHLVLGSPPSSPNSRASPFPRDKEWAILKSVMISAACIGLCLMSIINFAAAEIGALFIVPLCLMAQPIRFDLRAKSLKSYSRLACNVVLGLFGFPPITFFVVKGILGGFGSANLGEFWNWVESLWVWNSATYLYVFLVHLPCWVLCIRILFHHC